MKRDSAEPLRVMLAFGPDHVVPVGRLALVRGRAVLEYDRAFIASGLTINPRWPLPGRDLLWAAEPRTFEGLHGAFADSLPDAWGRELMRRRARANGIEPSSLTVLDHLAIVGRRGMGALVYEPATWTEPVESDVDLDNLSREAFELLAGHETGALLETLEELGDSSGGARPKILVAIGATGDLRAGTDEIPPGYSAWIVKFRAPRDPADVGPLEAAYADMARAAGVVVAPTTLLASRRGEPGYFATQRFDRTAGAQRVHALSVAALLETTWETPTVDYNGLMSAVRFVTRNHADVEQIFRRAVFNVAAHNRDDHAKQHAFLMDGAGSWRLAPAYDLNFSNGPGGEHYLAVNGKGDGVAADDLRALATRQSIGPRAAQQVIDDVRAAVADFDRFARAYDVARASRAEIDAVLRRQVNDLGAPAATAGRTAVRSRSRNAG
jgi:serine/threonine-protein kinase HipA